MCMFDVHHFYPVLLFDRGLDKELGLGSSLGHFVAFRFGYFQIICVNLYSMLQIGQTKSVAEHWQAKSCNKTC